MASPPFDRAPSAAEIDSVLDAFSGERVAVAMSGGVDSAVAALLLKRAGANPVGLSLRLHDPEPDNPLAPRACCPPDDLQDARRVAEALDIPFYVIDAREAFDADVVRPFVRDYLEARTPNPCVGCNSFVKLGGLARRARALGAVALATGHYARIRDGRLFAAADAKKDQSYFLFQTAPEILASLVFPIGAMTKDAVRRCALEAGLPVAHKLDSQEVCFVGGKGAAAYVMRQAEASGDRGGAIVDREGTVLGTHAGVAGFTIGQRKGLGLGVHTRLHVLALDAATKTVTVGEREDLAKRGLVGERASWTSGQPSGAVRAEVRIRYRSRAVPATIRARSGAGGEGLVDVEFDGPVDAVAPGQAAVFYSGDEVLGGAWIREAIA